ncbi:MAG TPA: multifunctional oxoglutarate decarboxylase/oxoglutarate dehydrogenase thiamine pyrophosphate-binding subunit/dihydrolipoyllysine-residue succinyltransferase subunit [Acidimicrobiales bacterium]|nr:multifunctional oxoglutarate decarboxylase/oxoglutarate dehydrogenase thiamine pyrophosphate-binding subunit/dihydrolipoyllysine-residue succinyltransferase subunit [Acidimicrobiales bacterium]
MDSPRGEDATVQGRDGAGRLAAGTGAFGPNAWLVEDMYERYVADPDSVSASWQEFFADYRPAGAAAPPAPGPATTSAPAAVPATAVVAGPSAAPATAAAAAPAPAAVSAAAPAPAAPGVEGATPLRGAAARIVSNMEASLGVPTATSVRVIPAKLLEVNRTIINDQLRRTTGGKVSFTHLIGYAVVQALAAVPAMNAAFVADADGKGTPGVLRHAHVGLGLAVDVEKSGGRTLLVPCIAEADTRDFTGFVAAYEDLVRKIHTNKIAPDDFAGTTVTLTNPGTIGTVQSVPRLMPGQGLIVGVGALGVPAGFEAADPRKLAELGVGKTVTVTSTYDHRIIQGAESGLFLAHVSECLMGGHGFYEQVFHALGIPYEPVAWQRDDNSSAEGADGGHERLVKQNHVQTLINMYRVRGHLIAHLDPLDAEEVDLHPELDPLHYGLTIWDLPRQFVTDGLAGKEVATLDEILSVLRDAYCRTLGVEYMHIQDPEQKQWIQQHVEGVAATTDRDEQRHILDRLNAAEVFERFLHTRYVGQKRFGLEGAESAIVILDALLDEAVREGVHESVMGMSHRGRLNVLANIVGKSYGEIFEEFEGNLDPESVQGSGDVKYHKGATGVFVARNGKSMPLAMASNPSHLEAVDPVVVGMARARQDALGGERGSGSRLVEGAGDPFPVLPILLHGDAAFAGQGVVAETLNLSGLAGYRTGGTVHVVINNQLGFTTAPEAARTSVYPTDVAKMVQAPIFHVNGDDPEACARAARLAFGFRQAFHKDVVIDMVCYRRHGHNEGDDPSYTQPLMYALIDAKRSVRKLYTEALVRRGDISLEEAEQALDDFAARLQAALDETRAEAEGAPPAPVRLPEYVLPDLYLPRLDTGIDPETVTRLATVVRSAPEGFVMHPKLARQFEQRDKVVADGEIDWALGEALAFGSLLLEGTNVRVTGQDTRRGTFSHRHAVLVDHQTGVEHVPLEGIGTGRFTIRDSLLSEYACVGFEYGYSVEAPNDLVAWEAQFGDFWNGAEIIVDNFLVAAEDKWGQKSGLVLLLPHGYEGQGPEHSSARIERFLTLCARGNVRVTQPTTSSQYFHLLRAQVRLPDRKPLIVFTPKSLLRARQARSPIAAFTSGSFEEVLDDPAASEGLDRSGVRRVVLCSGKVAFDALGRRDELGDAGSHVAVVRVEQLYPWPKDGIEAVLRQYPQADEVVWLQEEPENMGAWNFVHSRLHRILRNSHTLRHVSRAESASPASGSAALHRLELEDLLVRAVG